MKLTEQEIEEIKALMYANKPTVEEDPIEDYIKYAALTAVILYGSFFIMIGLSNL